MNRFPIIGLAKNKQVVVRVGPAVDITDGFTPEPTLDIATADEAELLKAGGVATVDISGNTWAAITGCDGWFDLTLTASNTDTAGQLVVVVQDDSLCRPVYGHFWVVESGNIFP